MTKLIPRICSSCGCRFLGKKMDYTCPTCIKEKRVTVEVRGNVVTEWRGARVIGCRSADFIRHS